MCVREIWPRQRKEEVILLEHQKPLSLLLWNSSVLGFPLLPEIHTHPRDGRRSSAISAATTAHLLLSQFSTSFLRSWLLHAAFLCATSSIAALDVADQC